MFLILKKAVKDSSGKHDLLKRDLEWPLVFINGVLRGVLVGVCVVAVWVGRSRRGRTDSFFSLSFLSLFSGPIHLIETVVIPQINAQEQNSLFLSLSLSPSLSPSLSLSLSLSRLFSLSHRQEEQKMKRKISNSVSSLFFCSSPGWVNPKSTLNRSSGEPCTEGSWDWLQGLEGVGDEGGLGANRGLSLCWISEVFQCLYPFAGISIQI